MVRPHRVSILTVLVILSISIIIPSKAFAAPLAVSDKDWQYVNGNSWAWNYSPQTQINKDNVANLEVKWIFPVGSKALAPAGLQTLSLTEGVTSPPIVRDGVVYMTTNFLKTYAIDAKTGRQVWTYDYSIDVKDIASRLPIKVSGGAHLHGFRYWENGNALLLSGMACDFYAIDAKKGEQKLWIKDLCRDVPGNIYKYNLGAIEMVNGLNNIGTYEKGRQFIYVLSSSSITRAANIGSRHVTMGIDMDTYRVLWRVFSQPPQDVPTKDWALQECDIGFFHTYPCRDVAAKNRAGLEWDWAFPGENPSRYSGVAANWGQPIIDEETGILYTQTGNQSPYGNMSMTPGPRLYGSTIMAIDMSRGQRIWWLQPLPHEPYDYDCNWNGILAELPRLGKIYFKGCKEGVLYALNAGTGRPVWTADVVNEQVEWGQIGPAILKARGEGGVKYYRPDPFSYFDMREWNWISYPAKKPGESGKYCTLPCEVYPFWYNGIFGIDMSYDPQTETLYHYALGLQVTITGFYSYAEGQLLMDMKSSPVTNATIVARDAATGKVKWTHFYKNGNQRSHIIITPGLLITGFTDGYLRALDTDTGKLLYEMNLGSSITVGPTMGKDSDGDVTIFIPVGTRVPNTPGSLVAVGLSERGAKTLTSTTTVTQTVEAIGPVTYGAIAVAVVAIIASAIIATRRRSA